MKAEFIQAVVFLAKFIVWTWMFMAALAVIVVVPLVLLSAL